MADYSAARTIAPAIRSHFARHIAAAGPVPDGQLAGVPDVQAIEAIIDVAFWASLRREEGYVPKISLALVPPELVSQPILFGTPLPLASTPLTKVAPAVERPGIHLGVWRFGDGLRVWGTTRAIPA